MAEGEAITHPWLNRAIETARGDKTLGASLEAKAVIYASDAALASFSGVAKCAP